MRWFDNTGKLLRHSFTKLNRLYGVFCQNLKDVQIMRLSSDDSHGARRDNKTHQHVLELDVAVHEALGVQEAQALDDVDGDAQAGGPGEALAQRGVQVAPQALHDQQHGRPAAAVRLVHHHAHQPHQALVLQQAPAQPGRIASTHTAPDNATRTWCSRTRAPGRSSACRRAARRS